MDDQVNTQPVPDYGGILPPSHEPPPILFPVERVLTLLSPLGLSPEQTSGVLNCMKETGLRWVIPQIEAAIGRTTEVMEKVVTSCFQEVAAGAIHSFGSYALLCVQQLKMENDQLKRQHQNEHEQWKEYAAHLMLNLNHQKEILEAEKKSLEEGLEYARRRCLCSPQTHTHKRGSSKRKGDQVEELEQRQALKKTASSRGFRQKLSSVISGIPVMTSQTLMEHLTTCAPPSMKLPPLEVPPPDVDMHDSNDQHILTSIPSFVSKDKVPEEESGVETAKDIYASRSEEKVHQFESSPCSDPSEQGENEKPKISEGTSGEQSVLTSSNLVEDSQSGANEADEANIQPSPDAEKATDEQEPSEKLRKTTSDGHESSFSTSKQGSEEGDNLQSVLVDDVDKADTTAALSLCQLGESLVPPESVMYANGGCLDAGGLDVPSSNDIECNFLQDSSHELDAKKKRKSAVRAKSDFIGSSSALDETVKRTPSRRKLSNPSGDEQKPLTHGSPTGSEVEAYTSRDHRRVSVVAKQLMAMSERKYG